MKAKIKAGDLVYFVDELTRGDDAIITCCMVYEVRTGARRFFNNSNLRKF